MGSAELCGSDWSVCSTRGRSSSMASEEGIIARGPVKDAVRDVRTRDW